MDPTLTAILRALFAAHQELDQLRARVAELEQQLADVTKPVEVVKPTSSSLK